MTQSTQPLPQREEAPKATGAQAVERALLLRLVGAQGGPISLQALCSRSGLNRTTAWRLLSTLEKHHFLDRNPSTKEYDLGFAATNLCITAQRRYAPLIRCAQGEMERLMEQTQESVLLSVLHMDGTVVIHQVDPPRSVRLRDYVDQEIPFLGTSNGKVALAYLSAQELDRFLRQPLAPTTQRTVADPEALRREVEETRRRGYGIVEGEWSLEENAISAPIVVEGELVAFLGIGGPSARFTRAEMERAAPALCQACRTVAAGLV